jgi:hypothetical protein
LFIEPLQFVPWIKMLWKNGEPTDLPNFAGHFGFFMAAFA